jgi:excisionase family DNA binding protein
MEPTTSRASAHGRAAPGPQHVSDAPAWAVDIITRLEQQLLLLSTVLEQLKGKCKPFQTVAEVAEAVGRSEYTVRRWIGEGRLKAIRVEGDGPKGRLLIAREELDRLVRQGLGGEVKPVELQSN